MKYVSEKLQRLGEFLKHLFRLKFGITWLIIFLLFFFAFYGAGLVPAGVAEIGDTLRIEGGSKPPAALSATKKVSRVSKVESDVEVFTETGQAKRVIISSIGVDAAIVNPVKRDFDTLNAALQRGAVQYPGSALPGNIGNMFLFGHSTTRPVVYNKAYTVFNRLGELQLGDVILIQSGSKEYRYRVTSVALRQADDTNINLESDKRMLTISTCNVIGAKEDRFVVEAEFVGSYPLRSISATGTSS